MGEVKPPFISLFQLDIERVTLKDGSELLIITKQATFINNLLYRTKQAEGL